MLFDAEEIQIMADCQQVALRSPTYSENYYKAIFQDFFNGAQWRRPSDNASWQSESVFEIGPGQFDFARLIVEAGAQLKGIDLDPAVVRLGKKRGFDIFLGDVRNFDFSPYRGQFTGLFCRGSINAFWYTEYEPMLKSVSAFCDLVTTAGWGWVSPYNAVSSERCTEQKIADTLKMQRECFEANGYICHEVQPERARKYKINAERNCVVYLKNINLATHLT